MSQSKTTKHDGHAVLFAVAELLALHARYNSVVLVNVVCLFFSFV